ncbi:RNA polymerase sigma factor [uncultured Sphingomonas sp.]|uniref:RNA polymerase sigma factor n=1 Tax=uncultured Sphingomonas sp. TaxID=158754 RepID=UPI0025EBF2A8|nr:RNA polymerase sigma factor [uncultured Sphingomonas sp.]
MDDGGLKAIFLEQQPILRRLLVARLGNAEDAEDALQDMWLRIDQLAQRPIAQPAAFLYRVAANLATDMRISAGRRAARDTAWLDDQPEASQVPNAERVLAARSEWQAVEAAIADMPERMAIALKMFRIEEQSQRTIAERLGISVSGVEKLLQRAYRKLHDHVDRRGEDRLAPHRLDCERGMSTRDR